MSGFRLPVAKRNPQNLNDVSRRKQLGARTLLVNTEDAMPRGPGKRRAVQFTLRSGKCLASITQGQLQSGLFPFGVLDWKRQSIRN